MNNQLKLDLPTNVSEPFGSSLLLTGRSKTVKLPGLVLDGFGSALGMMIIAVIAQIVAGGPDFFGGQSSAEASRFSQMDVDPPVN